MRYAGHAVTSLRLPAHWLRAVAVLWDGDARGMDGGLPPPPQRLLRSARRSSFSMAVRSAMLVQQSLRRHLRPTTR